MESYHTKDHIAVNGESESAVSYENLHGYTLPTVESKLLTNDENPESDSESRDLAEEKSSKVKDVAVERIAREIIEEAMGKATEQISKSTEQGKVQTSEDLKEVSLMADQEDDGKLEQDWLDVLGILVITQNQGILSWIAKFFFCLPHLAIHKLVYSKMLFKIPGPPWTTSSGYQAPHVPRSRWP